MTQNDGGKVTPINVDFEIMLLCAGRYCMGRMSYIVCDYCDYVKMLLADVSDNFLRLLRKDIEESGDYGAPCDRRRWMELLKAIVAEQKRREKHNAEQAE